MRPLSSEQSSVSCWAITGGRLPSHLRTREWGGLHKTLHFLSRLWTVGTYLSRRSVRCLYSIFTPALFRPWASYRLKIAPIPIYLVDYAAL